MQAPDLRSADLRSANLRSANLRSADLRSAGWQLPTGEIDNNALKRRAMQPLEKGVPAAPAGVPT